MNEKYAVKTIIYLHKKGERPKSTLRPDITGSYNTIKKLVDSLEKDGLVKTEVKYGPQKTITVGLTGKGEKVAEKLLEIEEILEE